MKSNKFTKTDLVEMIRKVIKEESKHKIKIVVCDDMVLGYIDPTIMSSVGILGISLPAVSTFPDIGSVPRHRFKKIRLATSDDFKKFRVSEYGYKNDSDYEYIRQ